MESLQQHTGVFHDRDNNFDSLGHFTGKTFIKYSNDDKFTDHEHVMTKIRTVEPLTVYIVKLEAHSLPSLQAEGYERSSYSGVSFSGIHSFEGISLDDYTDPATHQVVARMEEYTNTLKCRTKQAHMMIQGCNNNPQDLEPGCNVAKVRF